MSTSSIKKRLGRYLGSGNAAFWVTLFRAIFALSLGVALLLQPDKVRPTLANFMGMYWLISGVVSLRWGVAGEKARGLPLLAGVVGVLTGLSVLSRRLATNWVAEVVFFYMLGLVILLTGLLHIFGGFKTDQNITRQRSWTSFLLGVFEVILGLLLVIAPLEQGPLIYLTASIWALLGGLVIIGDALRIRRTASLD